MTIQTKSTKTCAGSYSVAKVGETDTRRTVNVSFFSEKQGDSFTGWIARAEWDRFTYTDPCSTKALAMEAAISFLTDAE